MFASQYGWTIQDVVNLTYDEVIILTDAATKRLKAGQKTDKKGRPVKVEKKNLEDMVDEFSQHGQLEDVK